MKSDALKYSKTEFHRQICIQEAITDDNNCSDKLMPQNVIGKLVHEEMLPMKSAAQQTSEAEFHRKIGA